MTTKLYYENSHLYEFTAEVIKTVEINGKTAVILNQTAFFPEGGGQPSDIGFIGDVSVYDVQEADGEILHYCRGTNTLTVGECCLCRVDAGLRFARMQAHSGEHIISGLAHTLYGVDNVGFHMDNLLMTVDFSKYLTADELSVLEEKANEVVYADVPVKAWFPGKDELEKLNYRSKLENMENTRLVAIEGVDLCACCAPHVNTTGEIGSIKILTAVSHRGGVRLTLICGKEAQKDYDRKHAQLQKTAESLKVKQLEVADAVHELLEKNAALKRDMSMQKSRFCRILAKGIADSEDIILYFVDDFAPDDLRELADLCKEKSRKLFVCVSGDDETGYAYAASSQNIKLKAPAVKWHEVLGGRGGGKDMLLGGKWTASGTDIIDYFNHLEVSL